MSEQFNDQAIQQSLILSFKNPINSNTMKQFITIFLLLIGGISTVFAQSKQTYPYNLIDKNRLIIQFEEGIDETKRHTVFDKIKKDESIHINHLPTPDLAIISTKNNKSYTDFNQLIKTLEAMPETRYVGLYLTNEIGHTFGILNQVFFKIKKDAHPRVHSFLKAFNYKKHTTLKDIYTITCSNGYEVLRTAIHLNADPDIEFAEPNYLLNPQIQSDDTLFDRQWALQNGGTAIQGGGTPDADMSVVEAWAITRGDPSIKIAVMDSGVDTLHPDLVNNILPGYDAFGTGTNGYPTPTFSQDAHGTACAGILAAEADNNLGVAGVAPECSLIPVRMFYYTDTPLGLSFDMPIPFSTSEVLSEAIRWAWQDAGADVQSHSWGLTDVFFQLLPGEPALVDAAIEQAVTEGRDGKGCLLFFSSGNEDTPPIWPGRLPNVMSVNATSMCDERKTPTSCDGQNWTGSWGEALDFGAPGVQIATTDISGLKGYVFTNYVGDFAGTSAACPLVAGVAALMLATNPDLDRDSCRQLLSETCDKVGGYAYDTPNTYGQWSAELGYGRINAYRAVLAASTGFTDVDTPVAPTFNIYPNPAKQQIWIDYIPTENTRFQLFNTIGQVIYDFIPKSSEPTFTVFVSHLKAGVYYAVLENEEQQSVQKVLVTP